MTNTKTIVAQDGDNKGKETELPILQKNSVLDTIVNVDFIGSSKSCKLLKLDFVSINGNCGSYYSRTYNLSTAYGTNGIFDFLDDFYSGRFKLFLSGKRIQSFILALDKVEREFYENMCYDFRGYCEMISEYALRDAKNDKRFSSALDTTLFDGYGISDESSFFYAKKNEYIKIGKHIDKIGKDVEKYFRKYLTEAEKKKFCCLSVINTEKIPPSFFIDSTILLPMPMYHVEFAEKFIKKVVKLYSDCEILKLAEIDNISIDLWLLMPNATVKNIKSITGRDGGLTCEYDDKFDDRNDFIIGKYKTLKYNFKSIERDMESDKHCTFMRHI